MTTYAVGDIQGCYSSLQALLQEVNFSPSRDTLWAAGDVINRGPESLKTLRYLYKLGTSFKMVLGNHDLHFLAVASGQQSAKRKDTLDEVYDAKDVQTLVRWLQQQPLIHRDKELGYTMVHAGIPPQWSVKEALAYAEEVHKVLRGKHASDFFAAMYGNEPEIWSDNLKGTTRLRVITNYLTRMRFCNSEGRLELTTKTEADSAPQGYAPWFTYKHHKAKDKKILFGHWAALMGETGVDNFIALDTGCVWGGELTLFDLQRKEKISISCECDF